MNRVLIIDDSKELCALLQKNIYLTQRELSNLDEKIIE